MTGYEKTIHEYVVEMIEHDFEPTDHYNEVLMMLVNEGLTNKEIAERLYQRFFTKQIDMI